MSINKINSILFSAISKLNEKFIVDISKLSNILKNDVDVTPNSVSWGDGMYGGVGQLTDIIGQQISGINSPITLRVEYDNTLYGDILYYNVGASNKTGTGYPPGFDGTFSQLPSNSTFTVNNNDWINFSHVGDGGSYGAGVTYVYVYNQTDSNTLLHIFGLYIVGGIAAP